MFVTLLVIHVTVSISLVLVVLVQTGRGAELGAAFGGMGQATHAPGQTTFVSKLTTGLAVVFMLTSLSLAFLSVEHPSSSLMEGAVSAPSGEMAAPAGEGSTAGESAVPAPAPANSNQ